jgi:hypothetical protein
MKFLSSALLALLAAAAQAQDDIDLSPLGYNDLSELDYEVDAVVDGDCQYSLTITFSHQDSFPVGTADTVRQHVILLVTRRILW